METLAILVAAAAAGFAVSHWLKLPVIPLLILFGFGLARTGIATDTEAYGDLMTLGLAFLVFSAGIELNPRRFTRTLSAVFWTSALQFVALAGCGFALARLLGFSNTSALCISGALATSSTFVVVRQLQMRVGSLKSYGRLAIGVLLLQDLAVIVVIVVLLALPGGSVSVLKGIGALVLLAGLAYGAQSRVFPWLARRTKLDDEVTLLLLLSVLFIFAGLAYFLGIPFLVGAFFGGFSLSAFPVNGMARSLLKSMSSFFLAIFFTSMGAMVELPEPQLMMKALAFVLLVLLVTPPLVTAVAEWKGGLSSRNAITSGLLLAQTSEFSLVLGLYALHLGQIPPEVMSVIAIVAVFTMTVTPLIASDKVARRLLRFHPLHRRWQTDAEHGGHVLFLGLGSRGSWVAKPLRDAGHQVVVVDHDPAVIEHLEDEGISCIRGDATDRKVLKRAGFDHAKLILISTPNVEESLHILESDPPPDVPVIVRVFEQGHADAIKEQGAIPVLNSHAAADAFMPWFESTFGPTRNSPPERT